MKERPKDLRGLFERYGRIITGLLVLMLLGTAATVTMCLTKDETMHISSGNVQSRQTRIQTDEATEQLLSRENEGCLDMDRNPLREAANEGVRRAVEEYYENLAGHADFVESYNNLCIYTKQGKYKKTYIAFVRYDMKIRDIYTEVPGLGTLYLEEGKDDTYQVVAKTGDEEIQEYVNAIVAHEDVKALMSEIQAAYAEAAASDAMLQEALNDLKDAYENQTRR